MKHLANACRSGFIGCQECVNIVTVMQEILARCLDEAKEMNDGPAYSLAFDILEKVGMADYPYLLDAEGKRIP